MLAFFERLLLKARAHIRRAASGEDMDEELRYHLERDTERNIARGMSPEDARLASRRAMGNEAGVRQQMRDAIEWRWLAALQRDASYALRALRRSPGFAATVIVTIAVALGLNTTVFTIFNAYVLRPLVVRDPGSLYGIIVKSQVGQDQWTLGLVDWEQYQALASDRSLFAEAAADRPTWLRIDQQPAMGDLVSGNFFHMLGVPTILGRPLEPDDTRAFGGGAVMVLSHRFWKDRYGGDSTIVGRTIRIRGMPFTVIGVVGPSFAGMTEEVVDFWAPVTMLKQFEGDEERLGSGALPQVGVLARLAPGANRHVVEQEIARRLEAAPRSDGPDRKILGVELVARATALPLSFEVIQIFTPIAAAFVLITLIACANVANMMLARGLARQREIGIRLALGAARARLVRQLMTEVLVLAIPAALLGYLLSRLALSYSVRVMLSTFPDSFRAALRIISLAPDHRVFLVILGLAVVSALACGLVPALQATRLDVSHMARGEAVTGHRPARLRRALVVAQIAGCLLLMVTAGVFLRSTRKTISLDPGLRTRGLFQADVNDLVRDKAVAALRMVPGIGTIAAAQDPPVSGLFSTAPLSLAGSDRQESMYANRVSAAYFKLLDLQILEGRGFNSAEEQGNLPVVVLSETAARRLSAGGAVGQVIRVSAEEAELKARGLAPFRTATVIGVVSDAIPGLIYLGRNTSIAYFPTNERMTGARLLFSVPGTASSARRVVEETVERLQPGGLDEVYDLEGALGTQLFPIRAASWISSLLGAIALYLTLTGLYGVLSYLVGQRTREIGIRVALGADTAGVVRLVLQETLRLGLIGGAIGLALALVVSNLFANNIEVLSTWDPLAYGGSIAVALAACLIAASVPSWRAARVDPLVALRE